MLGDLLAPLHLLVLLLLVGLMFFPRTLGRLVAGVREAVRAYREASGEQGSLATKVWPYLVRHAPPGRIGTALRVLGRVAGSGGKRG